MLFHTSLTTNSLLLFKDIKSGLSVQELLEILMFFDKWSSFFEAKIDVIQISFTLSNNHNLNQISSIFEKKYSENSLNETHSSYFCVTRTGTWWICTTFPWITQKTLFANMFYWLELIVLVISFVFSSFSEYCQEILI